MFSNWILCVLIIFAALGFNSELPQLSINRRISNVIFLFHICNAVLCTFYILELLWTQTVHLTILVIANQVAEYIFGLILYWAILIETFTNRNILQHFWQLYESTNRCTNHRNKMLKIYVWKFSENFIVDSLIAIYFLCCFVRFLHYYPFDMQAIVGVISYFMVMFAYELGLFYFLLFLELIKIELRSIENELRWQYESFRSLETKSTRNNKPLKWTRKCYQNICKLSIIIHAAYGWSIFVLIQVTLLLLLGDINYLYFYSSLDVTFLIIYAIIIIHKLLKLIYTFQASDDCTVMVNLIIKSIVLSSTDHRDNHFYKFYF